MSVRVLKINPADTVWVALTDLPTGETINCNGNMVTLRHTIPAKHKFTEHTLQPGEAIIMYGVVVGKAITTISAGDAITTQNVKHEAAPYEGRTKTVTWQPPDVSPWLDKTFMGYLRPDGQAGTANYWIVVPLVFCENRNVNVIREAFEEALGFGKHNVYKNYVQELVHLYRKGEENKIPGTSLRTFEETTQQKLFPNLDGIKFLTHEGGCGGTRQDSDALCALLAGYINNPNVAGATVLSLGCQHAQASILRQQLQQHNPGFAKPLLVFEQQTEGTEQELLARAIRETFLALTEVNRQTRQPLPLSKLVVGLECGGSDGFSGISANPAIGHTSDLIAALGGATILSEFPELCGVEQELINRTINDTVANRFTQLMKAYARAAESVGSGFDMNPSPGNIKDGLITDAMKSAGAAKKGGTSPITNVLDYGEYVKTSGLTLLCTPGNDVESTTAMAGAGANVMLFTTGLGTPTGNPVVPVIKLSSNTKLAQKMPDIIDINCGPIISGEKTIDQLGAEILDFIIEVASGRIKPKAVQLQQDDFIPWKRGVSL